MQALSLRTLPGLARYRKSFFIMELPEYKIPSLKRAVMDMCSRGWTFLGKAFTIIPVCNTVVLCGAAQDETEERRG